MEKEQLIANLDKVLDSLKTERDSEFNAKVALRVTEITRLLETKIQEASLFTGIYEQVKELNILDCKTVLKDLLELKFPSASANYDVTIPRLFQPWKQMPNGTYYQGEVTPKGLKDGRGVLLKKGSVSIAYFKNNVREGPFICY